MPRQLLRLPGVLSRTGLSRSMMYKLMKEDRFPRPAITALAGARSVAWDSRDVDRWIAEQLRAAERRPARKRRTA